MLTRPLLDYIHSHPNQVQIITPYLYSNPAIIFPFTPTTLLPPPQKNFCFIGYSNSFASLLREYNFIRKVSPLRRSEYFKWRQAVQYSPLFHFAVSRDPRVQVQYNAVNINSYSPCLKKAHKMSSFGSQTRIQASHLTFCSLHVEVS